MLRWPNLVRPEIDTTSIVSTIDIVPTIRAAVGVESHTDLPGIDLLDRDRIAQRDLVFGALFAHTSVDIHNPIANLKYRYAVHKDGWKLILPFLPNQDVELMINGDRPYWMQFDKELYHVRRDPAESSELSSQHPEQMVKTRGCFRHLVARGTVATGLDCRNFSESLYNPCRWPKAYERAFFAIVWL